MRQLYRLIFIVILYSAVLRFFIDFQLHMNPGTSKKVWGGVVHADMYLVHTDLVVVVLMQI